MSHKIIKDYIIVRSDDDSKLKAWIIEFSKIGYSLWGCPFIIDEKKGEGLEVCQGMVMYEQ